MDQFLTGFAPSQGAAPTTVLAQHPDGIHVALQTDALAFLPYSVLRSAIWDQIRKTVVWEPPNATHIVWNHSGSEIIILEGQTWIEADNSQPQSSYRLLRYTWPARTLLRTTPLTLPRYWTDVMLVSPGENALAINSREQSITAWEFVLFGQNEDYQLLNTAYENEGPFTVRQKPGFSADGHYAVSGYHEDRYWKMEQNLSYHFPVEVNGFEIGRITIVNLYEGIVGEIMVTHDVPAHTTPAKKRLEQLADPYFIDPQHFVIELPTGMMKTYSIR